MRTLVVAAAAGLLAVTAGCGGDSGSDADEAPTGTASDSTEEPTPDDGDDGEDGTGNIPACSSIWVDGQQLPADYGGCAQDDGSIAGSSWVDCKDGSKLYTHDDVAFFTLADQTIVATDGQSSDHPGYEQRAAAC